MKKWGEGAGLIQKEWKTREENDEGDGYEEREGMMKWQSMTRMMWTTKMKTMKRRRDVNVNVAVLIAVMVTPGNGAYPELQFAMKSSSLPNV